MSCHSMVLLSVFHCKQEMEKRSKAVLRFLVLCVLVQGIQGTCWAHWKFYKKFSGYWENKCTYCKCVAAWKWKCVNHCVPPPPVALPLCPNATVLKDVIVTSPVKQGKKDTGVKTGDWLLFDLKRDVILHSIEYKGKIEILHGDGMRAFSIALSNNNTKYYEIEEMDLQFQMPLLALDYQYVTRFVKFTYLNASGHFTPSFIVKGCQALTCKLCQNPWLCKTEKAQCKLPAFCSLQAACECEPGKELNKDQRTCSDIDECKDPDTCDQICTNLAGNYSCSCNNGYKLNPDHKTCTDIDECAVNNGGCDQLCVNQPGSYYCVCSNGYVENEKTKKCEDIDECINGPCSQGCINTIGSFYCTCNPGYKLVYGVRCEDIDECQNSTLNECDPASTICQNDPGSYFCDCKANFLREDNYTCSAVRCPGIVATASRQITPPDCTTSNSKNAGEVCSVSCADGYVTDVQTPVNLTCKANGYWDGEQPTCNIVTCPPLTPPKHGYFFKFACSSAKQNYQVECVATCEHGYTLKGPNILQCLKDGTWDHNHTGICEKNVQPPQLTCGKDITVVLKKGASTANITGLLQPPRVLNADPSAIVRKPATFDPAQAPYGRTELKYAVQNSAGHDYCFVEVVVEDKENPTVTGCPQTIHAKTGSESKVVTWKKPEFHDNVKILRVEQTRYSGSPFAVGKTQVNYVAMDLARNTVHCTFDVIVEKMECKAPNIKNGTFECSKFATTLMCKQNCNKGYAPYIHFQFAFCNNAEQGFSTPLRDCVPSVARKSMDEKCPDGYIPQINGVSPLCVKCPIGMYQDGTTKCTDCPPGKTTKVEGARDVQACQ